MDEGHYLSEAGGLSYFVPIQMFDDVIYGVLKVPTLICFVVLYGN
jgi:hypothetical protein